MDWVGQVKGGKMRNGGLRGKEKGSITRTARSLGRFGGVIVVGHWRFRADASAALRRSVLAWHAHLELYAFTGAVAHLAA